VTVTTDRTLRVAIIAQACGMNSSGLNQGTSGNLSARYKDVMLITPSGIPYESMQPADIAAMPLTGNAGAWEGRQKPSSEWRFHQDILKTRPEVGAIVHTHSNFATVLSMVRRDIPACHYMVAAFGGSNVRCADYATFGTEALSKNVLKALKGRCGCLLANHGMIATGPDLDKAMWAAVELETLAKQYYHALLIGKPVSLPNAEIAKVLERFKSYGPRKPETIGAKKTAKIGAKKTAKKKKNRA